MGLFEQTIAKAEVNRLQSENAELRQRVAELEPKAELWAAANTVGTFAMVQQRERIIESAKTELAARDKRIAELEGELNAANQLCKAAWEKARALRADAKAWRELVEKLEAGNATINDDWDASFVRVCFHAAWLRWLESELKESEAADGE